MQYIMQYEHTVSEELREISEKEAVEMAEKEENWEQERTIYIEELSNLREKITNDAGYDDLTEAFRDEINTLKEENNHLKQVGRDRDREMADQKEKEEDLIMKISKLEKESVMKSHQLAQYEDTIKELNRKVSKKDDSNGKNEWEIKKLKQRSEQALKLSTQLEDVMEQNDKLKKEVERVTSALENATELIKDTSIKYDELNNKMTEAEKSIGNLVEENNLLQRQLKEKHNDLQNLLSQDEISGKELTSMMKKKDFTIEKLNNEIHSLQHEIDEYKKLIETGNMKKDYEEEMETLKEELVAATKIAKLLFDSSDKVDGESEDPSSYLRVRLVQMDKKLEKAMNDINLLKKEKKGLEDLVVEKEETNIKIYKEIDRLRKAAFGDSDCEVKKLEDQIKYRDEQITKLIQRITLLEIHISQEKSEENENKDIVKNEEKEEVPKAKKKLLNTLPKKHVLVRSKSSDEKERISLVTSRQETVDINSWEASAILITTLNGELIRLLEEIEDKDYELLKLNSLYEKQEARMEEIEIKLNKIEKSESSTKLYQEEINKIKKQCHNDIENLKLEIEKLQTINHEVSRINSTINVDDEEKMRRLSETSRRLVYIEIQNLNLKREKRILEDKIEECNILIEKKDKKIKSLGKNNEVKVQEIIYQNELNIIEIARLQNNLINSVPQYEYERVVEKYKLLLLKTFNVSSDNKENINDMAFSRIDILKNLDDGPSKEQLLAEVKMLKNLNDISTKQNEYWQMEVERLKIECNEINEFLESFRASNDLQNFIGAIQKKFVNSLTNQQEIIDDRQMLEKKLKKLYIESRKAEKEWRNDRNKLIDGIMHLKRLLEREKSKNFYNINLDDLSLLREKMDIIDEMKKEIIVNVEESENEKNKLKLLSNNLEAMQESLKELSSINGGIINYQKAIQVHMLHSMTLNNNIKSLNIKLERCEKELNESKVKNEELEKINEELFLLTIKPLEVNSFKGIDFTIYENLFKKESIDGESKKIEVSITDDDMSSIRDGELSHRTIHNEEKIKTIIIDNSQDFENEIQSIKQTAHIAIEGYKEQLKQKNRSIEEYKTMVHKMGIEIKDIENKYIERIKQMREENRKLLENSLSTSNSKEQSPEVSQNIVYHMIQENLDKKEKECNKLMSDYKELEEAYLDMNIKYKNSIKRIDDLSKNEINKVEGKLYKSIGQQTSQDEELSDKEGSIDTDRSSSSSGAKNGEKTELKDAKRSASFGSDISSTSSSGTSSLSNTQDIDKQSVKSSNMDNKSIGSTREDMLIFQQKNEIRRLRTKVINVERRNKELETENSMLSDKLSKYTRKTTCDLSNNLDVENQSLKTEITKLRREAGVMRKRIENLNKQVFELEKANKTKKRGETISIERWKEKKHFDDTINILKKQLSESKKEQKELQEKLDRRDRLLEQLHDDRGALRVEEAMKKAKKIETQKAIAKNEVNILEKKLKDEMSLQQGRIDALKDKLSSLHNENLTLKKKITKMEKEYLVEKGNYENKIIKMQEEIDSKVVIYETIEEKSNNNENRNIQEVTVHDDSGYETTYRNQSSDCEESKILRRELRNLEIKCVELTEQITYLRVECMEHQEKYDILKEKYDLKDSQESTIVSIMLLKDKIEAKERLINFQRQRIEDLEKELWELNNQRTLNTPTTIFY
uniref:JAKMIP_CC3 domain-containing protein n=1 Tax=Parastrongyloides trichosuri TaxID=131310 RepID=A0A0N5A7D4_PARTI